jgi:hypothetical protein
MAVTPFKTFSAGEVLTAADLNSSFTQITNNGTDVPFPATKAASMGGFKITSLGLGTAATDAASMQNITNAAVRTQDFRLTLTSGTPFTTTDVTGATTIYAAPCKGNAIALYDGSAWNIRTSAEFSLALGTLSSGKPYDVFCYDSSGTPTLEFLVWTNDTTRGTALTTQNGVLVKNGDATRRYLGTFYTTSTTQTEDSLAKRFLWNYYHRGRRPMRVLESTNSWNYSTATIRQANAATGNQLDLVIGYSEDTVFAKVLASASDSGAAGNLPTVGVGLDSTTAFTAGNVAPPAHSQAAGTAAPVLSEWIGFPGVGRHFLSWNERAGTSGTTTWYGDGLANTQSGIHGEVWG